MLFVHDIHTDVDGITTSGQHRHQGGLGLFAIEGEGYSVVDDVRYDWKAGDFIMLPIKPEGCVHQHFSNHPGDSAKWLAVLWEPHMILTGMELEQRKVGSLV
jgi:gentisate 1,2-dioxygenase